MHLLTILSGIKNSFKKELRLIIILFLVSSLAFFSGFFAFSTLKELINADLEENMAPKKSVFFKEIFSQLSLSENLIKYYSISKDPDYLKTFKKSGEKISSLFNSLNSKSIYTPTEKKIVDSIEMLFNAKLDLLNQTLDLYQDEKILNLTQSLSNNMVNPSDTIKTKSGNWFSRLFKKRDQDVKKDNSYDRLSKKEILKDLKTKIESTQLKQKEILSNVRNKEIQINKNNKLISDHIQALIFKLEDLEFQKLIEQKEKVQAKMDQTKLSVAFFSFIYAILLSVIIFIIYKYARNNNNYRKILKKARMDAETLALNKEKFISNVSHELRTPMNAIHGFSEQLSKSILAEEQKKQVEIIKSSSDHLLGLINDLLDFSKLKAGKIELEKSELNLEELIKGLIVLVQPLKQNKDIVITYQIAKDIPAFFNGDALRIRQILLNLIGNSIKFTEKGFIHIDVKLKEIITNVALLEIIISDTGSGIPKNKIEKIFDEFERIESDLHSHKEGTGLGLSITKSLIEYHGGKIRMESEFGKGTKVFVELPLEISFTEKNKNPLEPMTIPLFKGKKVLIADDEEYNRLLLKTITDKWKMESEEAEDGISVIEKIKSEKFDLLFLDLRMPRMNGEECISMIRNKYKNDLPIIILSAISSEEKKYLLSSHPQVYFLSKPFKENDLSDLLSTVFKNKESMQPDSNKAPIYKADFRDLYQLSNGDKKFVSEMLLTLESSLKNGMEKISAIGPDNKDPRLEETLHRLSGPLKHINARACISNLLELETLLAKKTPLNGQGSNLFRNLLENLTLLLEEINREIEKNKAD